MIARLQDRWLGGADWGPSFWWFAVRYYLIPWFAWRWLGVRRDGARSPVWFKLSQVGFNFLRVALMVFLALAILASLGLPTLVLVFLAAAAVYNAVSLLMRAQAAYSRYGGLGR